MQFGKNERLLRAWGVENLEALGFELNPNELGRLEIILDDERDAITWCEVDFGGYGDLVVTRFLVIGPQGKPDGESRAFAFGAFHRQRSTVELRQELDHRQAESCTLILPG